MVAYKMHIKWLHMWYCLVFKSLKPQECIIKGIKQISYINPSHVFILGLCVHSFKISCLKVIE